MKHRVTVSVETKKRFLGIPYKTTEKKSIIVDGKTYRKMKQSKHEQQKTADISEDEMAACAMLILEEEMAELSGE